MIHTVRPVVAPAIPLFLALLSVLALGVVNVAQAQTVTLGLSSTSIAENGGTATVTATVSPASTTPFTVEISTVETADTRRSAGRATVSGTTLSFAANATTSTGTVTITAKDNDGHTPQDDDGVVVTVSGTVSGGTNVTGPPAKVLRIVEDDGIGTAADMTRPRVLRGAGTVDGDRVTLVFTEALKPHPYPDPDMKLDKVNFQVRINRGRLVRSGTVGAVTGTEVFLTLQEPVERGDEVRVLYLPPTDTVVTDDDPERSTDDIDLGRALQDLAGNPVYKASATRLDNRTKARVELVLTPGSIDEDGGESVVTARVAEASMTAFTVEVAVAPVAPATADDFTVSSNTVLSFAANATESTGEVTITAVDNGEIEDDLEVTVSGAVTGTSDVLEPMDETLTIRDDDRSEPGNDASEPSNDASIRKAWLARFGRMTAQHVLDGVRDRLTAPREAGLRGRIAGQAFNGTAPPSDRLRNVPDESAASNPFRSHRVTDRDLLTGTAFALTGATDDGGSGALWGRGGHSRFDGRDGAIRLDGRVTVATFGADYSAGRWLAGLALSRSRGEGIDPRPPGGALALGQHRYRGVVAMQAFRRHDMGLDQVVQRLQRHRARAHLVGQGRQAEIDAFARVTVALAVQRLMRAVLLEQDHRQQVLAGPAPRRRMERRRRLADLLATPAGELLAHRLDDLPLTRDHLQRLGHVLADLRQLVRTAAPAGCRRRNHLPLARNMRRERLAGRLAAGEPLDLRGLRRRLLGRQLVLGRARLELVELQFQLVEKTLLALRALPEELAPELLDGQLQKGDLGLGVGHLRRRDGSPRLGLGRLRLGLRSLGLRLGSLALGRHEGRPQCRDIGPACHRRDRITAPDSPLQQSSPVSRFAADQPARDGRQLSTGFRQSIPSSR